MQMMSLPGLIKLFEQKHLLITLVHMLIAQFGLKEKKKAVNPICAHSQGSGQKTKS